MRTLLSILASVIVTGAVTALALGAGSHRAGCSSKGVVCSGQRVYVKPIGWTCTMATAGGEPTFFCRRPGAYVAINRNGVGVHTGSAPRAMGGGFYSFKIP